jgi:hypothetical protein
MWTAWFEPVVGRPSTGRIQLVTTSSEWMQWCHATTTTNKSIMVQNSTWKHANNKNNCQILEKKLKENLPHFNLDFRLGEFFKRFFSLLLNPSWEYCNWCNIRKLGAGGKKKKLETSSKNNNYMHNANPHPIHLLFKKKCTWVFFLKLTCLTPAQGKNKLKNQNYVTLALGLVQARWRRVPGFGFVNSGSCGSNSSSDFAKSVFKIYNQQSRCQGIRCSQILEQSNGFTLEHRRVDHPRQTCTKLGTFTILSEASLKCRGCITISQRECKISPKGISGALVVESGGRVSSNRTSDLEMKHLFSRTGIRVLTIKRLTLVQWATTHILGLRAWKGQRALIFLSWLYFLVKKIWIILQKMQTSFILSGVVVIGLTTFQLPLLQDTPLITTADLLQAVCFREEQIWSTYCR